jgi:hypothetical protein
MSALRAFPTSMTVTIAADGRIQTSTRPPHCSSEIASPVTLYKFSTLTPHDGCESWRVR